MPATLHETEGCIKQEQTVTMTMTLQTMNLDYSNNGDDDDEDGCDVARRKGGLIDDWPYFAALFHLKLLFLCPSEKGWV